MIQQKRDCLEEVQQSRFFRWVLDSGKSLCRIHFSVRDHRLLPVLLVESQQVLNLCFFVGFPQLPMGIGKSHNTSDGDNRREEGGESFRSELANHWRESYPASRLAASN